MTPNYLPYCATHYAVKTISGSVKPIQINKLDPRKGLILEREKRFELSTSTLARWHSTS
jgi:hypothetical protein